MPTTNPAYNTSTRIPGLDGIRALAIILVIACHLGQRNSAPILHLCDGQDGVGLFFTLSGFLVTTLMLREHAKRGRIDILAFYRRRARRILPPLAAYIGAAAALMYAMGTPMPVASAAGSMLCMYNLMHNPTWQLEHTWSLAIEEQFYILWPLLLVIAMRWGRKGCAAVCAAGIVTAPALRIGGYALHWHWLHQREPFLLPTRMDALLAGCLVACCIGSRRFEAAYDRARRAIWAAPVLLFGFSPWLTNHLGSHYTLSVGYTANALLAAWLIVWVSRQRAGHIHSIANARPVVMVGTMSFSVYLYQTIPTHYAIGWGHIALALGTIAVMTMASFYGVEKWSARAFRATPGMWIVPSAERHLPSVQASN